MIKVLVLALALLLVNPANSLSTNFEVTHTGPMLEDYRMRVKLTARSTDNFSFRISFPIPPYGSPTPFPVNFLTRIYTGNVWSNLISPQPP